MSDKNKSKTIRNLKNLVKNTNYMIMYSYKVLPWQTISLFFIALLMGTIPLFSSKALGSLVDSLINSVSSGQSIGSVLLLLILYALINTLPNLLNDINTFIYTSWLLKIQTYLELKVLKNRNEIDIGHHENPEFQDKIQRAFNNGFWPLVNILDNAIENIRYVAMIFFGSIIAISLDWKIYLLVILTSVPGFIVNIKYGSKIWYIWQEHSKEQRIFVDLRRFFTQKISIIESKLLQHGNKLLSQIWTILSDFNNRQVKNEKSRLIATIGAQILSASGLFLGMYIIVGYVISGRMQVGNMIFILATLAGLGGSISSLLKSIAKSLERNLYATEILEVLATKPIIHITKKPIKLNLQNPPEIEFINVSFRYDGQDKDEYVLKDLSFKIKAGQKLGLVGDNGAGKSTLVRLLLRIHDPVSGEILINGINLKELDLDEWWRSVAVLLQDYAYYNFTAKESIAIGDSSKKLNIEKVIDASLKSTANTFIENWKEKYDQQIGVEFGGEELSKGQKQKMAIARVFYRDSFLMVLDEPTASIDAVSASKIFENIENLSGNVSAILISHNYATIKKADLIVVLHNGSVLEQGTHAELIAKGGRYAELFEKQKSEYTD